MFIIFCQVDLDGNGYVSAAELQKAFEVVGLKIPGHEVRALIEKHDISRDGRLDMKEFKQVRTNIIVIVLLKLVVITCKILITFLV